MARKARPPLPKRVKMGPHTFKVTTDPAMMEAVGGANGRMVAGFSTLEAGLIGIRADALRSHSYQADTLLHELIHCALRCNGCDLEDEERVVLAITTNLLHALRENPQVVAFLTYKD